MIAWVVLIAAAVLDHQHTQSYRDELRASAERAVGSVSRRIVSRTDMVSVTAESMKHAIVNHGGYTQQAFAPLVQQIMADLPYLSMIVVAPDFKPTEFLGRGALHGVLNRSPEVGLDLGELTSDLASLKGKVRPRIFSGSQKNLLTFVVPVFSGSEISAEPWGAIALMIDKHGLIDSGAPVSTVSDGSRAAPVSLDWLNLALFDVADSNRFALFGDETADPEAPVTYSVRVKDANWLIAATPRAGWSVAAPDQWQYRFALMLGVLAILVPVFIATSLISERNRIIATLERREANLLELSRRLGLAMEASNMGIWEMTEEGQSLIWDERSAALHGKAPGGRRDRLGEWLDSIHAEDKGLAEAHFLNCIATQKACTETYRVTLPDGSVRYLRSAGTSFRGENGTRHTTGIVWEVTADILVAQTLRNAKDNSDIKNAELELALDELSDREQKLEELSQKLDLALASYGCGIWEFNPQTGEETWDARMCQLYGVAYTGRPLPQNLWFSLMLEEDRDVAAVASGRYLQGHTDEALLVRVPQADGTLRYVRSVGQLQTGRDGSRKLIGLAFDVTKDELMNAELKSAKQESDAKNVELELAKSRIEHNSLHDPLTLLSNRRKLDMELDRLSRASQETRQKFSILHLDLDRFKQINDTLGHAAGDAMLVHASRILSRNVRGEDIVARIGGDEFVILVPGNSTAEELALLSQRIIAEFRQPLDFEGLSCRCGVSIGIAQASGMKIDARRILVNADIALYRAKGQGRNGYEFFTQNLQAEIISQKRTADEVLSAIDNHEFVTWYQPQFSARTGKLTGVEALIRWNHPHHGILAPDRFLKIAEDLNVAAVLDQLVLETVLKDKMRWAAMGLEIPKVSVNVSSKRLHDQALIDTLKTLPIRPGEISFELVESIFLDDGDDLISSNLERIKALGIDIELDDFGTGHTSIVSLLKLKPKRLKIDRQLVMPILSSPQERTLVRSIIDIARSLGVDTVAEGVETMQHASILRDLGCDLLQGYAFSRPLPFDRFVAAAAKDWKQEAA